MNLADKFIALTDAMKIYKELCIGVINKGEEQNFEMNSLIQSGEFVSAVFEKYPTARKHIKNTDIEYLRYLAKYLMKISMLDKTNLYANITEDNSTLHLALNKE